MRKVSLKRKRNGDAENDEESVDDQKNTSGGEKENGDDDPLDTNEEEENNDEEKVEESEPEEKTEEKEDKNDEDYSDELAVAKKKPKKAAKSAGAKRGRKPAAAKKDADNDAAEGDEEEDGGEEEEEEEYEVQDIVDHKVVKGKTQYLIRWKGWGPDGDTWEPEGTLSCPDIVTKYLEKQKNTKGAKKTSPKKANAKGKRGRPSAGAPGGRGRPKKAKVDEDEDDEDGDEEDDGKEYDVDKIIDVHFNKGGRREFLIRWKGWGPSGDTWEPEEHLNCTKLIEKYMEKVDNAKSKDPKELRADRKRTDRLTMSSQSRARRLSKRHDGRQRAVYYDAE